MPNKIPQRGEKIKFSDCDDESCVIEGEILSVFQAHSEIILSVRADNGKIKIGTYSKKF